MRTSTFPFGEMLPESARIFMRRRFREASSLLVIFATAALGVALATWSVSDPSLNHATDAPVRNAFGSKGAIVADLLMQLIGVSSIAILAPLALLGWRILTLKPGRRNFWQVKYWLIGVASAAAVASLLPATDRWPLPTGLGGVVGDAIVTLPKQYFSSLGLLLFGLMFLAIAILSLAISSGFSTPFNDYSDDFGNEHAEPSLKLDFGKHRQRTHKRHKCITLRSALFFQNLWCDFQIIHFVS